MHRGTAKITRLHIECGLDELHERLRDGRIHVAVTIKDPRMFMTFASEVIVQRLDNLRGALPNTLRAG
jgi:hypothetical protein